MCENYSGCDGVAAIHGYPHEFVQAILPKPAIFLFEYEEQLSELSARLKEIEACEGYAKHARVYLRKRCDSDLNCLAEASEFFGWPPSLIEQMVNEAAFEDLLQKGSST